MKKLLFFFFAFMLHISINAQSIDINNVSAASDQLTTNLATMVSLTTEQQQKVRQINNDKLTNVKTLRQSSQQVTAIRAEFSSRKDAIREVLTASQKAILDQGNVKRLDY